MHSVFSACHELYIFNLACCDHPVLLTHTLCACNTHRLCVTHTGCNTLCVTNTQTLCLVDTVSATQAEHQLVLCLNTGYYQTRQGCTLAGCQPNSSAVLLIQIMCLDNCNMLGPLLLQVTRGKSDS